MTGSGVLVPPRGPASRLTIGRLTPALVSVVLVGLLVAAPSAGAATQTFSPVADTSTRSDQPGVNFGTSVRFSAEESSPRRRAYLRFNVGIPAGSSGQAGDLAPQVTLDGRPGRGGA